MRIEEERKPERSDSKSIILPSEGWGEATAYRMIESEIFSSHIPPSDLTNNPPLVASLLTFAGFPPKSTAWVT